MGIALFSCGVLGILGMTWLFPYLGLLLTKKKSQGVNEVDQRPLFLSVLIPAHNEEAVISDTIRSIKSSLTHAQEYLSFEWEILLLADGCSDATAEVATAEGATVIVNQKGGGKWKGLTTLFRHINVRPQALQWVAYADAGILWSKELVKTFLPWLQTSSVMGVAPTYKNPTGGVIEKALWSVERHFKSIETSCGGPISIHGATIFYRYSELDQALTALKDGIWLNDDVVLPLTLRTLFYGNRIQYSPQADVHDQPTPKEKAERHNEVHRRRRMMLGNLQWIRSLLRKAPWQVKLLAYRRVFRVFWAYWVGALCLGAAISVGDFIAGWPGAITAVLLLSSSAVVLGQVVLNRGGSLKGVLEAAYVSLLAPWYLLNPGEGSKVRWR